MASQKKVNNNKKTKLYFSLKKHKWLLGLTMFLIAAFIYDLSAFGGNIQFYSKWAECGQKPVAIAGSGYFNSGAVHYYNPSDITLSRHSPEYFCTPLEAEQAGYSSSPDRYEFPNLDKSKK